MSKLRKFLFSPAFSLTAFVLLISITTGLLRSLAYQQKDFPTATINLAGVVLAFFAIFLNLLIARKWLSREDLGLRQKGFVESLFYSTLFFFFLRSISYLADKEMFLGIPWRREFPLCLTTWFVSAFHEELVYRGIIFGIWKKQKGFLTGMLVSSALFGLIHAYFHVFNYGELFFGQAIQTFSWGPTLAFILYRTGNIWGLSIAHFLNNLSVYLFMPNLQQEPIIFFRLLWYGTCIVSPFVINKVLFRLWNSKSLLDRLKQGLSPCRG